MQVFFGVGKPVMMTMMPGPPERAFLHGAAAKPRQDKLKDPARLEGAVGEVAMIAGGDAEHPDQVRPGAKRQREWCHPHPDCGQAGDMHEEERQTTDDGA